MAVRPTEWLRDKVYEPKRRRTVDLVRRAVDALRQHDEKVSLASVTRKSREVDSEGRGVSESAILHNDEAKAYFDRYRTTRTSGRRRPSRAAAAGPEPTRLNLERNTGTARQRYLRMCKPDLVARLLAVEQAFSQERLQRLQATGEALADPEIVHKDVLARRLQRAEQRANQLEQLHAQAQEEVRVLREDNDGLMLRVHLLEAGQAMP